MTRPSMPREAPPRPCSRHLRIGPESRPHHAGPSNQRRSMPIRAAEPTRWHNQVRRRSASGRPVQLHGSSDSGNSFDHRVRATRMAFAIRRWHRRSERHGGESGGYWAVRLSIVTTDQERAPAIVGDQETSVRSKSGPVLPGSEPRPAPVTKAKDPPKRPQLSQLW
jgi:hypothetical protein